MSKIVMVETLSQFRHRYAVELPDDSPNAWAVDTVLIDMPEEFAQSHLGELDFSHRVISKEEYLRLFDEDNSYLSAWDDEHKMKYIVKPKETK